MKLPNGDVIYHRDLPYDPVKAHQYYIRTRQLKGRKPGLHKAAPPLPQNPIGKSHGPPSFQVKLASGQTVSLNRKALAEQKKATAKRVADIKKNLTRLNSELRKLMRDAKKKKDHDPTATPDPVVELQTKIDSIKQGLESVVRRQRALTNATKFG